MNDARDNFARSERKRAGRHGIAVVLAAALVLVLLGAVAYASVLPNRGAAARDLRQRGKVRIGNSRGHRPIVGMKGMVPGARTKGRVRISNKGRVPARFFLGVARLREVKGTGGGLLSQRLVVTVTRLRKHHRPRRVYRGPMCRLRKVKLGVYRPGERRTYRFRVVFPSRGAESDNTLMGASARLSFKWSARPVHRVRAR